MRSDIDTILKTQNIDALWVMGAMKHNADMVYFTGTQEVKSADLFKLVGKPPVVYHATAMEREEAAKSGLETHAIDTTMPLEIYLKKNQGDFPAAMAERTKDILKEIGVTKGRIGISGTAPVHIAFSILDILEPLLPDVEFTSFLKDSAIQMARMTKETDEVARIRKMGQITICVVRKVADFLTSQKVKNNTLVGEDGKQITISIIKSRINLWLAELGAENPEETIFAIGRDAGIPHSGGNPEDKIELGKPIVFDIYPCEKGGGYFYDFTRTWCLGYAHENVQTLYNQVLTVHHQVTSSLEAGKPFKYFQEKTCKLFSDMGHVTIADKPETNEGYVHSIGHGLGLDIHEKPFSGITSSKDDILKPGVVFTIEPGLYYPSKNVGVRIEDTVYLNTNGTFEILADYPYDLVLPMKNNSDELKT
jgi:Xaa-Pro aminopeptidase